MYTAHTATREQALKAAAAAERAMERHECCKSQFKFKCFSCGEMINRGDKITKCTAPCWDGMRLRFRGADAGNGLTMAETAFYLAETGTRTWVHIGCNPCYWDSLPEDSNEYSPPALRSAYTGWGCKISYEFDEWRQRTNHYDMEEFLEKHGYPQEKWMKDRIIHSVTRFQAIWRGYLYKKSYPTALAQHKTIHKTQVLRYLFDTTIKSNDCMFNWLQQKKATEAINDTFVPGITEQMLHCFQQHTVGEHCEILFDKKNIHEAVYSAEIIKMQGSSRGLFFWVKFHADEEVRKYDWRKFLSLKKECRNFKRKMGIEAKIIGKIMTRRLYYLTIEN